MRCVVLGTNDSYSLNDGSRELGRESRSAGFASSTDPLSISFITILPGRTRPPHRSFQPFSSAGHDVTYKTPMQAMNRVMPQRKSRNNSDRLLLLNFHVRGEAIGKGTRKRKPQHTGGHPRGAAGLQHPQTPKNRNLKNTDFVVIMMSKVLRCFPFSRNHPLKSADD
jgi:hypothetical protein